MAAAFLRTDTLARQRLLGRTNRRSKPRATDDHRLIRLTALNGMTTAATSNAW